MNVPGSSTEVADEYPIPTNFFARSSGAMMSSMLILKLNSLKKDLGGVRRDKASNEVTRINFVLFLSNRFNLLRTSSLS